MSVENEFLKKHIEEVEAQLGAFKLRGSDPNFSAYKNKNIVDSQVDIEESETSLL